MKRLFLRRGDYIALAAVLAAAAVAFFAFDLPRGAGSVCEINAGGNVSTYALDVVRSLEITNNGYTLDVRIGGGEVWVEEADCPDRICVRTGRIGQVGQSIVCLPAKISIVVRGEGGPDGWAG